MRKFAITITAATMIIGGLAGCGVDNQARDMGGAGAANREIGYTDAGRQGAAGAGAHGEVGLFGQGRGAGMAGHGAAGAGARDGAGAGAGGGLFGGAGFGGAGAGTGTGGHGMTGAGAAGGRGVTGARWTGEGPITDMFTPNNRAGRQGITGYGVEQRQGQGIRGGQLGVNDRGAGLRGTDRTINQRITGPNYDMRGTGMGGAGFTGRGMAGRTGMTGAGTAVPHGTLDDAHTGMGGAATRGAAIQGKAGTRGAGMHGQAGTRQGATGITGGNREGMVDQRGVLRGQNRTMKGQTTANYHRGYDGQTVQEIERSVENMDGVRDCRVVMHDDEVVVAVEAKDKQNQAKLEEKVENNIENMVRGKNVHVVTDKDAMTRVRTMDDRLRGGAAFDEVGATFTEMVRDLGRAAGRPFERTRN